MQDIFVIFIGFFVVNVASANLHLVVRLASFSIPIF